MDIITRRTFLGRAGCGLATAAALNLGLERLGLISAFAEAAPTDFRALVCIFLQGGNDANNMVIPNDPTGYAAYQLVRGASGLAIPQSQLASIQPLSINVPFGFHPSLATLKPLFDGGQLAVVCNVGPLVAPLTRQQYQQGTVPRPYQLFSHSDQQEIWQTSKANSRVQSGWGGRLADKVVALNLGNGFPVNTSVAGSNIFGRGQSTRFLGIGTGALNQVLLLNGFDTTAPSVARRTAFDQLRGLDRPAVLPTLVTSTQDITQQALDISTAFSVDPTLTTVFPNTGIGNQLKQVAKLIKLNLTSATLGLNRMVFFTQLGGFDTHQNEVATHTNLFTQLSGAMTAFYAATVELGVAPRVTTFTLSDFGRTFQPSGNAGNVGTDHGWGNHQLVMGGAVRGTDFYGVAGPSGTVLPVLQLSGPSDTDSRGRWIPQVAVEQYAATLALWFGVSPTVGTGTDLSYIFPNIGNFSSTSLGFLV